MTTQEMKISTARIGVLIGKSGSTKREIEEKIGISLRIDSEEGLVTIEGEDPVNVMTATNVISAINRGFSPERAFRLLDDEDMMLDILDLADLSGSSQRARAAPGPDHRKSRDIPRPDRGYDRHGDLGPGQDRCDHRSSRSCRDRTKSNRDADPGRASRTCLRFPRSEEKGSQTGDAGVLFVILPGRAGSVHGHNNTRSMESAVEMKGYTWR